MTDGSIRFEATGSPDVLSWAETPVSPPGPGEALVRHDAVGVNFIDVYFRTGTYPAPLPSGLGMEGAGVVEAVGDGVTHVAPGDRVAYCGGPLGAYATARSLPASRLVKLPDSVGSDVAASVMLKGLTVEYLVRRTYAVQPGDTVLLHAAAGGVGLIACQWLKLLGATVIGVVGNQDKAALAQAHGADHTILTGEDVAARVREITGGAGVPVVYDSVGRDTLMASLDSLRPRGMMVSFGNASGMVPPVDLGLLASRGSLFITRPSLTHYAADRGELETAAAELFRLLGNGSLRIGTGTRYALRDAAQAHRDLEGRRTTGSLLLIP